MWLSLHHLRINLVVLFVRPEESDTHDTVFVSHHDDQTIVICFDVKNHSAALENARLGMSPFNVLRSLPLRAFPSKGFAVASIHGSGLIGLVDIGDHELNAARSEALEWNAEENRRSWLSSLRPKLLGALDALVDEGDIPARYGFIVKLIAQHDIELMLETNLPWVTVRVHPGNAILMSPADLIKRLDTVSEVFLVYGGSPWYAEKIAREQFQVISKDSLILPISQEGQPETGSYDDDDEVIEGTLEEHFAAVERPLFEPDTVALNRS
jgi:hypothetical protein